MITTHLTLNGVRNIGFKGTRFVPKVSNKGMSHTINEHYVVYHFMMEWLI
jgi:hypothetical protein